MGCFRLSDANKLKRENVCEAKLDQLNSTTFQPAPISNIRTWLKVRFFYYLIIANYAFDTKLR